MATHLGRRLVAVATAALLVLSGFALLADPVLGCGTNAEIEDMASIQCNEDRTTTSTRPPETTSSTRPAEKTTTTAAETTTTVEDDVLPTSVTTTTIEDEVLPTSVTTTTIEDEVLPTSVTTTTIEDEVLPTEVLATTLPFTGASGENLALLGMAFTAIGALVLVGFRSRVPRGRHVRR